MTNRESMFFISPSNFLQVRRYRLIGPGIIIYYFIHLLFLVLLFTLPSCVGPRSVATPTAVSCLVIKKEQRNKEPKKRRNTAASPCTRCKEEAKE